MSSGDEAKTGTPILQIDAEEQKAASSPKRSQLVARLKPLELGSIQGNQYQDLKGLTAGEKIVVSGFCAFLQHFSQKKTKAIL